MNRISSAFSHPQCCLPSKSGETYPVEVVEGGPELIHLLLSDALCVSRQDLGLHLIDGSGDGRQQHLPPDTNVLPEEKGNGQLWVLLSCPSCPPGFPNRRA